MCDELCFFIFLLHETSGGQRSWSPGEDLDGGLSGPPDVLVRPRSLSLLLQQGELLQEEAAAVRSLSQWGERTKDIHDEGLPPLLHLLLVIVPVLLRQQAEEDGEDVQVQAPLLTCSHRYFCVWNMELNWSWVDTFRLIVDVKTDFT